MQEPIEYRAKVKEDSGTIRGHIPAKVVSWLGGKAGDTLIFTVESKGKATIRKATAAEVKAVEKMKTARASGNGTAQKTTAKKTAKKAGKKRASKKREVIYDLDEAPSGE